MGNSVTPEKIQTTKYSWNVDPPPPVGQARESTCVDFFFPNWKMPGRCVYSCLNQSDVIGSGVREGSALSKELLVVAVLK